MNTDIVVEIQNREQFNIVREYTDKIFKRNYSYNSPVESYGLPFCIHFYSVSKGNIGCYSNKGYYQGEGATIITFEQFERDYLNVIPEDYTGRYVKALIDRPHGGSIVKGDIGLVISDENNNLIIDFPFTKGYLADKEYVTNKSRFELMPVDYKPESISKPLPKFKVGDIVNTKDTGYQSCKGGGKKYSLSALELIEPKNDVITPVIGEWYEFQNFSTKYIGRLDEISSSGLFVSSYWRNNEILWQISRRGFEKIIRKAEAHEIPAMEKKKQYQFKKGDKVRCIGTNDGPLSKNSAGRGWVKNKEFVIWYIAASGSATPVAFPEHGDGVYFTHLELVTEEVTYLNPLGVKVGDWVQATGLGGTKSYKVWKVEEEKFWIEYTPGIQENVHQYFFRNYPDLKIDHEKAQKEKGVINTYGLKVGDILPEDIITKWSGEGLNFYSATFNNWKKDLVQFVGHRKILSFNIIKDVPCFLVSGTHKVYLRSEGFKEFMDSFNKPKIDDGQSLIEEAKRRYSIGSKCISPYRSESFEIRDQSFIFCKQDSKKPSIYTPDTYKYVYWDGQWAQTVSSPVFDNKKIEEQINIRKFAVGDEIEFITKSTVIPEYYTEHNTKIPSYYIKHGSCTFRENKGVIQHIYEEYYIVSFIDYTGKIVQLGFKANVLRLKKKNVTQYPLTEKECYIATVDPYDKQNEVFVKLNSEVCNIKVNEPVKVTLKNTNDEVKITVNPLNQVKIKI